MKNIKILLIEDNPGDARLIKEMISEARRGEYQLEWRDTLSRGLDHIAGGAPDIILLDLGLPESQGLDTFLRVYAQAPEVPTVVLTGLDDAQFGAKLVSSGAQDYLVKGQFHGNLLMRTIRYAIERKRSEKAIRESEASSRILIEKNADGIVIVDNDGRTVFVNPAAEALFQRTADELVGEASGFPLVADGITEIDISNKGGEIATVQMRSTEIEWEGERAYLASLRDVTELSRARIKIDLLVNLVENARYVMVFILETSGRIVECNALARITFGYSKTQMYTRNISGFLKFSLGGEWEQIADIVKQKTSWRGELTGICRDGREFPLDMALSTAEDVEAQITQVLCFARDITKEKEIDRMKSEFISVASHEMRTPLTSIKNAVDIMLKKKAGDITDTQEKFLSMAERNVTRLNSLITDLLDISKMEAGKINFDFCKIDLRHCIEKVKDSVTPLIAEKSISLKVSIAPHLPSAYGDSDSIEHVLINIIGNAIKFTPDGGAITINACRAQNAPDSTEDMGGFLEISAKDDGIGIPEEFVEHIFEKFYQVESSLSKLPGTGLGLAISKNLVEAHGGTIWCKSKEGNGTRISFTIPVFDRQHQFRSVLNKAILKAKEEYSPLALLIIRLVNISHDTEGADTTVHEKAVQIIKEKAIEGKIKKTDMISIFPMNAEIAIIMPNTGRKEAQIVQKRIECQASSTEIAVEGFKFIASHTGGIASFPQDGQSPEELLDFARNSYESTQKSCRK